MRLEDATLLSCGLGQGTVFQTAIGAAYIRARLHVVSAYPVIDRSHALAVAFSKRFTSFMLLADAFPLSCFGRRFNIIYVFGKKMYLERSDGILLAVNATRRE